jgi:putative NIF3 family GTP cyclohydrolase 1 type 2
VPEPGDETIGTGRLGRVPAATTLGAFAGVVAAALPPTSQGVRIAGDLDRTVRTIAVCGGSGDAFLAEAALLADAYVTSDLRHHRAQDHLVDGGCALIDVAHWASEWPWLPVAATHLEAELAARGSTVDVHVSRICTDPWTSHLGSPR